MECRVLQTPASTKAEHGVRTRVLISASDAKSHKLASGDACWVDECVVGTIGVLNTIKAGSCMLSQEALEQFPANSRIRIQAPTRVDLAESIILSSEDAFTPSTLGYLVRRWENCIVSPGSKLGVFLGGAFRVFRVERTTPANVAVRIDTQVTSVQTSKAAPLSASSSSSVILVAGGLQQTRERLLELIRHHHEAKESRFPPPRTAILFGPSGSGKTLLAKEIVASCSSSKIVLLDDADLMEEEEVAAAITMAGGDRSFVLATNSTATVSEQVRKRFDVEVEVPPPNAAQRAEILTLLLDAAAGHSLTAQDVERVANRAHGFVGADLQLLVKQGKQACGETRLELSHLLAALKLVKPSCLREAVVTIPNVRWEDIGGMDQVKRTIRESVELPLKHPEAFLRLGIRPPSGILLYGPPGCSKTLLAKAVATESEMNFIAVKGPELLSKWVGDSEKAVQATFRRARLSKPCVVFFDEIDALAVQRSSGEGGGGVSHRVTSQLLQELDGIEPRSGVIVLCATNRPDLLDVALMRPGRIDRLVYVPPPDDLARLDILRINLKNIPHSLGADMESLLRTLPTQGFSGAEVASICRNAALLALEEECDHVSFAHLQLACSRVVPQISPAVLAFYNEFKSNLR